MGVYYLYNDYLMAHILYSELEEQARREESAWVAQQDALHSHLERTAAEEEAARRVARGVREAELRQQAQEQARRRQQMNDDRFGSVDGGFYANFGKSCR